MNELPFTLNANDPDESDVKEQTKKEIMMDLNAHHIGVIESYDAEKQTAKIRIAYKRARSLQDESTGVVTQELIPYPVMPEVPVMFLRGGNTSLRFMVKPGDECLLLFVDRDIDYWYTTGNSTSGCETLRMHALSDAVALVGIGSVLKVLPPLKETEGLSVDRASLGVGTVGGTEDAVSEVFSEQTKAGARVGKTFVMAAGGKVTIKNETKDLRIILQTLIDKLTDLNSALTTLVTQTSSITVPYAPGPGAPVPSGPPVNAAAITAVNSNISTVNTALATIKADLGVLLT
jgi:hypothetical protein